MFSPRPSCVTTIATGISLISAQTRSISAPESDMASSFIGCRSIRTSGRHGALATRSGDVQPHDFGFFDLFGDHGETRERMRTEGGDHRDVRRVTPSRDQDAANPRPIVPRVEGKPATAKKGFEPGVEIHRRGIGRDANVAE